MQNFEEERKTEKEGRKQRGRKKRKTGKNKMKQIEKQKLSQFDSKLCAKSVQNSSQFLIDKKQKLMAQLDLSSGLTVEDKYSLNPELSSQFCFTIEGNIGCGKSTFLELLRERLPEAKWIEEPVSEWQNVGGKEINILEKYYKEPNRWGFTFQIYAIFTRIKALKEACQRFPQKMKISQRSILADKFVFSQLMKDLGYMDEAEYQVFKSLYANFQNMTNIDKTKVIYLKCSPEKCYERTKIRKRQEEDEIPLQYLQMIHEKHEKWFKEHDPSKVLVIETTQDFKNNPELINEMFENLKVFVNKK